MIRHQKYCIAACKLLCILYISTAILVLTVFLLHLSLVDFNKDTIASLCLAVCANVCHGPGPQLVAPWHCGPCTVRAMHLLLLLLFGGIEGARRKGGQEKEQRLDQLWQWWVNRIHVSFPWILRYQSTVDTGVVGGCSCASMLGPVQDQAGRQEAKVADLRRQLGKLGDKLVQLELGLGALTSHQVNSRSRCRVCYRNLWRQERF